jgi:hypothetical protein
MDGVCTGYQGLNTASTRLIPIKMLYLTFNHSDFLLARNIDSVLGCPHTSLRVHTPGLPAKRREMTTISLQALPCVCRPIVALATHLLHVRIQSGRCNASEMPSSPQSDWSHFDSREAPGQPPFVIDTSTFMLGIDWPRGQEPVSREVTVLEDMADSRESGAETHTYHIN